MSFEVIDKPSDSFRILHTADWHLGKLLGNQSREEEHKRFLDWLLKVVNNNKVDAIILAGDVFDTVNPPQSALTLYYNFCKMLFKQGNCSLVVIAGNHDSARQLEAPKQVLQVLKTHVVGSLEDDPKDRILYIPDNDNPKVGIAMIPYLRDRDLRVAKGGEGEEEIRAQVVAGIQRIYQETAEATANIKCPIVATGHLTVLGASTSDSERDIHIGGLGAITPDTFPQQFSYVALGHLHRPQATDGDDRVRYSGSPIPLSFSETQDVKEVRILDCIKDQITHHSLPIPVSRRLSQIRTTTTALENALENFDPDFGELRTWVEVVIEDATLDGDLNESVRKLVEGRNFDVLKVLRGSTAPVIGMSVGESTDDEAMDKLLQPVEVFKRLLEDHEEFAEKEIEGLKIAFNTLVDLEEMGDDK